MTRFNLIRNTAIPRNVLAWGKTTSALLFAAILIFCSLTVGCSSDKPKTVSSNVQMPTTQAPSVIPETPAQTMKAEDKPKPKKIVRKRPSTVMYSDSTYGVQFEYPRKYGLETGDAASDLAASNPLPMDFVQPGGVVLAAVELPESSFANTDFSSGFFSVNVHKGIPAADCEKFSVPQPKSDANADEAPVFMLGDMELKAAEAVAGEGARQSDSKYFHLYQNGACYEFVLNVTTLSPATEGQMKHVDRDQVFNRLEKIMATVKINPITPAEQQSASVPEATPAAVAPEPPVPQAKEVPATPEKTDSPAATTAAVPNAPQTPNQ